ncbi:MAG: hypothetical protein FJ119_07300 [Deltaproteobacteria bacterium]|nr:hypothetical protein [Deltaproteobacteria bacterium]
MICETTKKGVDCLFMSKQGCSYKDNTCKPVVEQCTGCEKAQEFAGGTYCAAYPEPALKWKTGKCNFATHIKREAKKEKVINALKASKRKAKGR